MARALNMAISMSAVGPTEEGNEPTPTLSCHRCGERITGGQVHVIERGNHYHGHCWERLIKERDPDS
jgi:hypothetical protein